MMKKFPMTILPLLAVALCLTSGCYLHRMSYNYRNAEELEDSPEAVLDSSGISPDEQDRLLMEAIQEYANDESVFTINAGDTLNIRVYDQPELNDSVVVAPDGKISVLLAGQIKVAGLTPTEAEQEIEKRLEEWVVNPKVGVSPSAIHSETVTITGAIGSSGMYAISNGMRLADLVAQAGGSAVRAYEGMWLEAAVWSNAVLFRDGKSIPVNFVRAIKHGDYVHNIALRKGDYIYVPSKDDNFVYVIGDVGSPQKRIWLDDMGLLELLASCGWVNETYWDHVIIIRGGIADPRMYKVDLGGILKGTKRNVRIQPNDIVYLPKDDISEYNVFVRKIMPTIQLIRGARHLF